MPGLGEELPLILGELDDQENETNISKLLRCWLSGMNGLEYAEQQLFTERFVDTAVGAQLDIIGKIVGQKRNGLVDDIYRRYIRARVSANRSRGTKPDILKVVDLVVYDDDATYVINNELLAEYQLTVQDVVIDDAAWIDAIIRFIRGSSGGASASAVRPVLETWPQEPEDSFVFGGTGSTGDDAIGEGFGNTLDAADGGAMVSQVA